MPHDRGAHFYLNGSALTFFPFLNEIEKQLRSDPKGRVIMIFGTRVDIVELSSTTTGFKQSGERLGNVS
mgnify:FL=1